MRGRGICLALLVLAACQFGGTPLPPDPGASPIASQTLPPPSGAGAAEPVPPPPPAPEPAPEPAPIPQPPPEPPLLAQQRAACRASGGQLMPRAAGLYTCVRQTRDAGRRCAASRDCEGLCLARSASCAPLTPLYGCHDIFTAPGRRETLCTD